MVTATAIDADGNTSEFSRDIGRDYKITSPPQGKLWVVGDVDTIRWEAADTGHVRIEFSSDSGFTYHIITADTDGAAREFPWEVEKARSTRCRIRVSSVDDPSLNGESDYFKVKGVELTRYTADSSYEAFDPAVHGWSFANAANIVWAPAWYNQFDYVNGIDPGTMKQYPAAFTALPVNAKSADFPDWPLFVSAFGVAQCYFASPTGMNYRPSAITFWASLKGRWGGSCYGFAVSSLMAFDAPATFALDEPEMPPFVDLYPLATNAAHHLQNTVSRLWIYTAARINKIQSDNHASDPLSDILDALRSDFLGDTRDDRIISFWANGGGHSLAPYKIEKDPLLKNLRYLYLYDSNNPGARDNRVVIDIATDGWYFAPLNWANTNHFVISKPVSTNFPLAQLPKVALPLQRKPIAVSGLENRIEVYNPAGTSVRITSETGGRIEYADSVMVDSIAGANIVIPPTGGLYPPIGCSLPPGKYTVDLSRFPDTTARMFLFTDSVIYSYDRKTAPPNQHDLLQYDGGLTFAASDTSPREIGLHTLLVQQDRERAFDISGLSLDSRDTVRVHMGGDASIDLISHGSPHSYNLLLTDASNQGEVLFSHSQIQLPANSTHRVLPDWSDLGNKQVKILIDAGNHGLFMDSLLLSNQLTSVEEQGSGESSPGEFRLFQNYPNPFNPKTVIRGQGTGDSRMRLAVYDLLGREVAVLANGRYPAGRYSFTFDGSGSRKWRVFLSTHRRQCTTTLTRR